MVGVLLAALLFAWLLTSPFYWWRRGVPSVLPIPLFGNALTSFFMSSRDFFQSLYSLIPGAPYVGVYFFTKPVLLLRDPKVISEVLEEKSAWFNSHGVFLNEKKDPLARSVFHLSGPQWKKTRSRLSPFFSPSKVKLMMDVGRPSLEKLLEEVERNCGEGELEMHSYSMCLTVDMTAASIFGLGSDVFREREESDFYRSAVDLNTPLSVVKGLACMLYPFLYRLTGLVAFTPRSNSFIQKMIEASFGARKNLATSPSSTILMDGLVQLMATEEDFNKDLLISQGAVMWVGGVETTASTLSFALHELARHPEIQRELRERLAKGEGRDLLKDVITETLRMYPVFSLLSRYCISKCKLSTGLEVEEGTLMLIPVQCLHYDPAIYPNPYEFQPGRPSPKGSFLSFGAGPRTCLGMRLGRTSLEVALARLLERFEFRLGSTPLELEPRTFFTKSKTGVWLRVRRLDTDSGNSETT